MLGGDRIREHAPDGTPGQDGSSPTALDAFAAELEALRIAHGGVSYAELAERISRHRAARGTHAAAARVARSTVYDAFRPGRRRISPDLVADIVVALTDDEDEGRRWRDRAVELMASTRTLTPAGRATTGSVSITEVRRRRIALAILICIAAVGLSLMANFIISTAAIPIYLDMVGTALVAFAMGPWPAVAVGAATNVVGMAMNGDFSGWGFGLVQIAGAIIWGYGFRGWFGRGPVRFVLLNVVVAIVSSIVAVLVIMFLLGGVNTHAGIVTIVETVQQLGVSVWQALFSVNMLSSLADKLLSGFIALGLFWMLVRTGAIRSTRNRLWGTKA